MEKPFVLKFGSVVVGVAGLGLLASIALGQGLIETAAPVPLKEAKLVIEHDATGRVTGFQAFVEGEGWRRIDVVGPQGRVFSARGEGSLSGFGVRELFVEIAGPETVQVPVSEVLAKLPEGRYRFSGPVVEGGEVTGSTLGFATLTHVIPAGPVLRAPAEDAVVSAAAGVKMRWSPVTRTIDGRPVPIIAYQLIVERVQDPHPNMIPKINSLNMVLPGSVTEIELPEGFLRPGSDYDWEVLAIEPSGNQTLSSSSFRTR